MLGALCLIDIIAMNILVTGASGFIGQRLVNRFVSNGHRITGSGLSQRAKQPPDFTYISADLALYEPCLKLVEGIDTVVHCAGKAGAWGPKSEYEIANVTATMNMLKASRAAGVRRFINLSSASIYFDYKNQFDLKESERAKIFSNAYAETKFAAEQLVNDANSEKMRTISLRPRGVVGIGDRAWLPRIIAMRKSGRLIQAGPGDNLVDFTSVENLVDAIELCLTTKNENCGKSYNITDGGPERLWDFTEFALSLVGLDGKRRRIPTAVAMSAARLVEAYHVVRHSKQEPNILPIKVGVAAYSMTLDISAAKKALGYWPKLNSRDSVRQFAEWWKTQV